MRMGASIISSVLSEFLELQGEIICITNSFLIHNGSNSSVIKNVSVSLKAIARITLHVHYINATPLNNKQPSHTTDLTPPVNYLGL
jgi:hypothetical protein